MKSTYTETYKLFLLKLIEARKAKGITQAGLAEKLKRPQSFISKIENGERRVDVVEFLELTNALGVNPNDIINALPH